MTAPNDRDCRDLPPNTIGVDDEFFLSAQPANDNDQDWIKSLSRSCEAETVASLEESRSSIGINGIVVLAATAASVIAITLCYIIASSFRSIEQLLN
jgi:hypothetical protein